MNELVAILLVVYMRWGVVTYGNWNEKNAPD